MAIIKRCSFGLVLSALLFPSVIYGQNNLDFDNCAFQTDFREKENGDGDNSNSNLDTNRGGSQRRTYGNLCTGSCPMSQGNNCDNAGEDIFKIQSRINDPFRKFCDLIDRFPNVKSVLATGNSPHTIFAPTDAAMSKVDGLIDRIDDQSLLELHILPEARTTADLRCGQTYRTLNVRMAARDQQRSMSRCISAFRTQQLGAGNLVANNRPTIGVPTNIFNAKEFESQRTFILTNNKFNNNDDNNDKTQETISQDVISCNGVIHVVDDVLLPGNSGLLRGPGSSTGGGGFNGGYYGGKGGKGGYGGYGNRRGNGGNYIYGGVSYTSPYRGGGYGRKGGKGYGAKGGKGYGAKGGKGYRGGYGGRYRGGFFRKLDSETENEDANQPFLTDAEFFGTNELVENEADEKAEDLENRKRRLEALLEPDGNIAQV